MTAYKRPLQGNRNKRPVSFGRRFFNYKFNKIKSLTKVGLIIAGFSSALNGYAETDNVTITVHMNVVADDAGWGGGASPSWDAVDLYDPRFADHASDGVAEGNVTVRTTYVEGETYSEILPGAR